MVVSFPILGLMKIQHPLRVSRRNVTSTKLSKMSLCLFEFELLDILYSLFPRMSVVGKVFSSIILKRYLQIRYTKSVI